MITRAYLHGGEARCHVFLSADGRLVDIRHPPFEGLFFLCGHLCVRSFDIPLLLLCDVVPYFCDHCRMMRNRHLKSHHQTMTSIVPSSYHPVCNACCSSSFVNSQRSCRISSPCIFCCCLLLLSLPVLNNKDDESDNEDPTPPSSLAWEMPIAATAGAG